MYLYPKTIRKNAALGAIAIAVRKPNVDSAPEEAHTIYIENDEAHYATSVSPQSSMGKWKQEFTLGAAQGIAIEFDAKWLLANNGKYRAVTLGEPWLFRIRGISLLAQKGETSTPLVLDTGTITKVATVRGWQNVNTPVDDHGIIVLYIKEGKPYYVNYSQQPQGYKEWSTPKLIEGFSGVTAISGFRTNDYRICLLISVGETIHQISSARNWAGIGVSGERASATADAKVTLLEIAYHTRSVQSRAAVTTNASARLGAISNLNGFVKAHNDDAFTIVADLVNEVFNLDLTSFTVKDSRNRGFRISSIEYTGSWPRMTILVEDFNNAIGDMTISYIPVGTTTNILGSRFEPFQFTFTPQGLEPVDIPLPKVISITNVEG